MLNSLAFRRNWNKKGKMKDLQQASKLIAYQDNCWLEINLIYSEGAFFLKNKPQLGEHFAQFTGCFMNLFYQCWKEHKLCITEYY